MTTTTSMSMWYVSQFLKSRGDVSDIPFSPQMSLPGSPGRSRPGSRPASRPHSPTRGSRLQPITALKGSTRDPLRVFPTDISQRIFSMLSIKELARCSRVSKKWNRSQTLNYGAFWLRPRRTRKSLTQHRTQSGSSIIGKRTSTMRVYLPANGRSVNPNRIG